MKLEVGNKVAINRTTYFDHVPIEGATGEKYGDLKGKEGVIQGFNLVGAAVVKTTTPKGKEIMVNCAQHHISKLEP